MDRAGRSNDGSDSGVDPTTLVRRAGADARRWLNADRTSADADQTAADADQTYADADHTAAESDQLSADRDQRAANRDQAAADIVHDGDPSPTVAKDRAYDASREERDVGALERLGNRILRAGSARDRDDNASKRDRVADGRADGARVRDASAVSTVHEDMDSPASLLAQLQALGAEAAAERARAAADRARAAQERAAAARERRRLESELRTAHLDELTGAYRREMGREAISHEIDRARRSDGRFVLAFVDVDRLKTVNDTAGHGAGDRVLQQVVTSIRARLRSFDPVMRYGGDEFVCGLGGVDLKEAALRFEAISQAVERTAGVGISVGLAALADAETADALIDRADVAMLLVKASHHAAEDPR